MTTSTTWTITQTDYQTADGFITTAHWTANATDGDYTASIYSTCSFAAATPAIPYANVTEAQVLEWIWNNGVDKEATEAALATQIEAQKAPVTATGTPWSLPAPTPEPLPAE
jgi:hypothetical protein